MSDRNQLPQSGWNLPPGVSENDPYFTDESEDTDVEDGEFNCSFCQSSRHGSSDCPDADESVEEHLFGD